MLKLIDCFETYQDILLSSCLAAWSDNGKNEEPTKQVPRPPSGGRATPLRNRSPGEGAHMGSVPSMRSVISVKEAAEDQRVDGMTTPGSSKVTPAAPKVDGKTTGASKIADGESDDDTG